MELAVNMPAHDPHVGSGSVENTPQTVSHYQAEGLLEHGGSIAWAWLTGDGETLLEYLDANNGAWVDEQEGK